MADYFEIVLDGDADVLRGFVTGYLAASGLAHEVFVAREYRIEHDSLAHQLAEWIVCWYRMWRARSLSSMTSPI